MSEEPEDQILKFEREGGKVEFLHSPASLLVTGVRASIYGLSAEAKYMAVAIGEVMLKVEQAREAHQVKVLDKIT